MDDFMDEVTRSAGDPEGHIRDWKYSARRCSPSVTDEKMGRMLLMTMDYGRLNRPGLIRLSTPVLEACADCGRGIEVALATIAVVARYIGSDVTMFTKVARMFAMQPEGDEIAALVSEHLEEVESIIARMAAAGGD